MHLFVLHEQIDKETTLELIEWINSISECEKALLVIESNGGEMGYADIIVDILNQNQNIELVIPDSASSAAAYIFLKCSNDKKIGQYFRFLMLHLPDLYLLSNQSGIKDTIHNTSKKAIDRINKTFLDWASGYLNKDELKQLKKGKDVYLSKDRVDQILNTKTYIQYKIHLND
jgi:ATP-dependent protease ClpP protease subunit